jgi:hypothetical protein
MAWNKGHLLLILLLTGCYVDGPEGNAPASDKKPPTYPVVPKTTTPNSNFKFFLRGKTETWTPPPGVSSARVELWGGHGVPFITANLAGKKLVMGGGGGYARKTIKDLNAQSAIEIKFSTPNGNDGLTVELWENGKRTLYATGGLGGKEVSFNGTSAICQDFQPSGDRGVPGTGGKAGAEPAGSAQATIPGGNGSGPCVGSNQVSMVGKGADPTGEMNTKLSTMKTAGEADATQEGWEAQAKISW